MAEGPHAHGASMGELMARCEQHRRFARTGRPANRVVALPRRWSWTVGAWWRTGSARYACARRTSLS